MTYISSSNKISVLNSSTTPLSAGQSFIGVAEDVHRFESVLFACKTDKAGALYADFSIDGENWDSTLTFDVDESVNDVHRLTSTRKYFRIRFTNTSDSSQTYFRLQTMFGTYKALTSSLGLDVQSDADTFITKSILFGQRDNGQFGNIPVTSEGHLEVAIHEPTLPYGSLHTENLRPILQDDCVYGIDPDKNFATTVLSGTVSGSDNLYAVYTGTTLGAYSVLQSTRRLRYRPGQGLEARFSSIFSSPVSGSIQIVGIGTSESGLYFGYNGTSFGILHVTGGVRQIVRLHITTKSSSTDDIIITLNDVPFTVTGITNGTNTAETAFEISEFEFDGWRAESIDSYVYFLAHGAGLKTGTFSMSQTGGGAAVGSFTTITSGAASIDTWHPQSSWNLDPLDGTGPSGKLLDPTKGNNYQIDTSNGFGTMSFYVENNKTLVGNNNTFSRVHEIKYPNSYTTVNLSQPSMPFTMAAYSITSTSNISVKTSQYAGFVEGQKILNGGKFNFEYVGSSVGSTAGVFYVLGTIRNNSIFRNRANQSVVNILNINGINDHTQPISVYVIKNATLEGPVDFNNVSTTSTCSSDDSATTCTITDNNQILYSRRVAKNGGVFSGDFTGESEVLLQPGETLTIAARASAGSASNSIFVSINTREDQ